MHVKAHSCEVLAFVNVKELMSLELPVFRKVNKASVADLKHAMLWSLTAFEGGQFEMAVFLLCRTHKKGLLGQQVDENSNHITSL